MQRKCNKSRFIAVILPCVGSRRYHSRLCHILWLFLVATRGQ